MRVQAVISAKVTAFSTIKSMICQMWKGQLRDLLVQWSHNANQARWSDSLANFRASVDDASHMEICRAAIYKMVSMNSQAGKDGLKYLVGLWHHQSWKSTQQRVKRLSLQVRRPLTPYSTCDWRFIYP